MKLFEITDSITHRTIKILGLKIGFKHKPRYYVEEGNQVIISPKVKRRKLYIHVRGKNNTIIINDCYIEESLTIHVYAENSRLEIGKGFGCTEVKILMGVDNCNAGLLKNANVSIGENVSITGAYIGLWCGNTSLTIGDNCMFANNVTIFNADAHPIYKKGTDEIVNRSYDLYIGKHCWLAKNVTVLKNSYIPDNTIVRAGTVIDRKFDEEYCAISGNPAVIVERDVEWKHCGVGDYIENMVK